MKTNLAYQVDRIVDDKIARISRHAYAQANTLPNGKKRARHVRYTLPAIIGELVAFRAECANPDTSADRLEAIAAFATNGEPMHKAHEKA
jgi:hypothetical protein